MTTHGRSFSALILICPEDTILAPPRTIKHAETSINASNTVLKSRSYCSGPLFFIPIPNATAFINAYERTAKKIRLIRSGSLQSSLIPYWFIYSSITSHTESTAKASCHSATPAISYLLMIFSFTRIDSSSSIHTW